MEWDPHDEKHTDDDSQLIYLTKLRHMLDHALLEGAVTPGLLAWATTQTRITQAILRHIRTGDEDIESTLAAITADLERYAVIE